MKAYDLRPAMESEKDRIFESYRVTVGSYIAKAWGWDESFQRENFWKHHPFKEFNVIQVESRFGGGLHLEEDESDVYIRMIFLLPEFQGFGIGSRLITDIHGSALSRGKGLSLKVLHCNPAKRLHERLGFVVTGRDEASQDMRRA
jgi:GNAT superfamily N-acetyltransferase